MFWIVCRAAVRTWLPWLLALICEAGPAQTHGCSVSKCILKTTSPKLWPKVGLLHTCKHSQHVVISATTWLWSAPDFPAASRHPEQRGGSARPSSALQNSTTFSFAACQEAAWFQSWCVTAPDTVWFRAHNLQRDPFGALKPRRANGLTAISNQRRSWFPGLHGQRRAGRMLSTDLIGWNISSVRSVSLLRQRLNVKQRKYLFDFDLNLVWKQKIDDGKSDWNCNLLKFLLRLSQKWRLIFATIWMKLCKLSQVYLLSVTSVCISNKSNCNCVWTQFGDKAPADVQSPRVIEVVWLRLFSPTFLWLLRTEGVTKAFSHRSHLYFLWPSCTTWMWTLSVSFLLKVASHWSHLNVLSPAAKGKEEHFQEPFPLGYC